MSNSVSGAEADIERERMRTSASLSRLKQRIAPQTLMADARESVQSATAPLVAQAKSSRGLIFLGATAAALLFGAGRASTGSAPSAGTSADNQGIGALAKPLVLSAAALGVGAFLSSRVPLSEQEKRFGASTGKDLISTVKDFAMSHANSMASEAGRSLTGSKGIGLGVTLLSLAFQQLNKASHERN